MATIDLSKYGITGTTEIIRNPSYEFLFEEETKAGLEGYDRGQVTDLGAVNVMTGIYTGRSPKDKFIVMDLRRVQKRQQARLSGGLGCLQEAGAGAAVQQAPVCDGCVLRRQPRLPHGHPLHHGGGMAGPLREEHVHPAYVGGA